MFQLFLGFALDESFEKELKKANPYLVSMLTGGEIYLSKVAKDQKSYLGKYPSIVPTLPELEQLERNILSLLKKIAPEYPFAPTSLKLLAIAHANSTK